MVQTKVEINGHRLTLDQRRQLGPGGSEGNVFLATLAGDEQVAVKIYHTPTPARAEKLAAFLAQDWQLPLDRVAFPQALAHSVKTGAVVGFAMPYLRTRFSELARLANRRHRNATSIDTREIVDLFLDGATTLTAIHQQSLVVGDFSDQNALYSSGMMHWIDVDSWQFAAYPCPVGTEDFLAPELYGIDLGTRPMFQPCHDWYTFAVHLFRSVLLTHPYGGDHREYKTVVRRAERRIWVLDSSVTYPGMAHAPELLTDELLHTFENIFVQGKRGVFPVEQLKHYQDVLVTCSTCQRAYPRTRQVCPLCQARTLIVMAPVVNQVGVIGKEVLRTPGLIIFAKVSGDMLTVVAYEDDQVVFYQQDLSQMLVPPRRLNLFKTLPGATFDLFGTVLVMHPPQGSLLYGVDIAGERPQGLFQIEADVFSGTRRAMFQAARDHLLYIQNGTLMMATWHNGALHASAVRTVVEQQTWFSVDQGVNDRQVSVFGFFRVFRQLFYWFSHHGVAHDIALDALDAEEVQLDIQVLFSAQGVFVRRFTQERGVDYLRTALLDSDGKLVFQSRKVRSAEHGYATLRGQTFAQGMILHPTDEGIVQEQVRTGGFKTFKATQPYVGDGDIVLPYGKDLIVIKEHQVVRLSLPT